MSNSDQSRPPADLIKLIYTIALEPRRLYLLLQLLDDEIEGLYSRERDPGDTVLFADLQEHIEQAQTILSRQLDALPQRSRIRQLVDLDRRPAFTVSPDMMVTHANEAAKTAFRLESGKRLANDLFVSKEQNRLTKALGLLKDSPNDRFLGVFEMEDATEDDTHKMVLSRAMGENDEPVGHLASLKARWEEQTGAAFSEAFGLTAAETNIVRATLEGDSLKDVADKRGRSLGTVRNQSKRILSKLNLHSRTELVCLYAGFSQLTEFPTGILARRRTSARKNLCGERVLRLPGGDVLEYELAGPEDGKPCLLVPPLIGGTGLTAAQTEILTRENIKLVMPWLPDFKQTRIKATLDNVGQRFAVGALALLDELNIASAPVMSVNTSTIYALEIARLAPDRIERVIAANAPVPFLSSEQFQQISIQQRIPYYLARHLPFILNFYVKSIIAKMNAGYEVEFISKYYEDSPIDGATILRPDVRALATEAIVHAFAEGAEGVTRHIRLQVSPWQNLLVDCPVPIIMVNGDLDTEYSPAMVEAATRDLPHVTRITAENAGTLVWFQRPDLVFPLANSGMPSAPNN